jgi:hypothetical protein
MFCSAWSWLGWALLEGHRGLVAAVRCLRGADPVVCFLDLQALPREHSLELLSTGPALALADYYPRERGAPCL